MIYTKACVTDCIRGGEEKIDILVSIMQDISKEANPTTLDQSHQSSPRFQYVYTSCILQRFLALKGLFDSYE